VDIREVATTSIGFCEHIIHKAGVNVVKEFADDVPPVYGIQGQLEQVFVNLITNACHTMRPEGGRLTVQIEPGQEGTLCVRISDEGEGIAAPKVKRIFEPFFTTKVEGEGTGLGLSIVKNIITSHDGDITVSSVPGEGTTFTITLYTSE
jgi:signal transduction histidine kinase